MKNTKKFSWKSTTDTFNTKSLELEQIQERRLLEDGDDLEGDSQVVFGYSKREKESYAQNLFE